MTDNLSFVLSSAKDTIDLYPWLKLGVESDGLEALEGITGFGPTGQQNRWFEGAGHGASYRGGRILPRTLIIPLYARAKDRMALNDLMSRISAMINPDYAPVRLTYGLPDGELWYSDVVREDGGDYTRKSKDSDNRKFYRTTLTLKAGDPFWTRIRPEAFYVVQDTSGRGLLPNLAKLEVSLSGAFGTFTVNNPGDAEARPFWTLNGPFTHVRMVGPNGEVLDWTGNVAADRKIYIDTREGGTVIDDLGVNRYDGLAPIPKFWKVPPGISQVSVNMDGTSLGTVDGSGNPVGQSRATCQYWPRRWGVI